MPNRRKTPTTQLIRTIRRALRTLGRNLDQLAKAARSTELGVSPAEKRTPRHKMTLTPARRAALKLQGQYMG